MDHDAHVTGSNIRHHRPLSRRGFLATTAFAGALAAGPMAWAASTDQSRDINEGSGKGDNKMKPRKLGKLEVCELGAGCMSISANYGPPADKNQGIAVLRAAHEKGVIFFDTAEVYGPYTSEELVGEALAPFRDKVVIASKFGFAIDGTIGLNSRPEHIKKVAEASLKRLRTDRIDLYYQHRVDPAVPIEDVAGAIKRNSSKRERFCTLASPNRVREPSAGRMPCSRLPRSRVNTRSGHGTPNETASFKRARNSGIGFVPWAPLGEGYLTGKIYADTKFDPKTDLRSEFPRFTPEALAANRPVVDLLKRFAEKKNATPAQIALAWLLAQKPWIVPIPGTRNLDHLNENLGAINVQLTPAELGEIETAFTKISVQGERMSERHMGQIDRTV